VGLFLQGFGIISTLIKKAIVRGCPEKILLKNHQKTRSGCLTAGGRIKCCLKSAFTPMTIFSAA
jgi:hypothetical protein